jgi:hypothetical protein
MASANKALKWILWPAALVGLAWCVYFVGTVFLENDEVADCKLKQWMAGGKKPPDVDLISNSTFQNDGNDIVADFRKLATNWSQVCLTTVYQPNSPYLSWRDAHWGGSANPRTIGCWAGEDPSRLTLLLVNRHTGETEYHRISIWKLKDPMRGPTLDTSYRIPELPDGLSQCSKADAAVARCKRDADENPDYCLLVFHQ